MPVNGPDGHQHNSEEFFEQLLNAAINEGADNSGRASNSPSDSQLENDGQLNDYFLDEEARIRSRHITTILEQYAFAYTTKAKFQNFYRKVLFWGCSSIVVLFCIAIIAVVVVALCNLSSLDLSGAISIITPAISLVVAILELVRIITKYCFPENDEQYIVDIVTSIQTNDLEKYKENNRANEASGGRKP